MSVLMMPKNTHSGEFSLWSAGIATLFLAIGLSGAVRPLQETLLTTVPVAVPAQTVELVDFSEPAAASDTPSDVPPVNPAAAESLASEEPVVPELVSALEPTVMPELIPEKEILPKPEAMPEPTRPEPVAAQETHRAEKPAVARRPNAKAAGAGSSTSRADSTSGQVTGTGSHSSNSVGSGTAPQVFRGSGNGKFPAPRYPNAALSSRAQGEVRLLVTVESSGLPGSVVVAQSCGHSILDKAAREQVQRRWRWPDGSVRRYIVPIKFVLQ